MLPAHACCQASCGRGVGKASWKVRQRLARGLLRGWLEAAASILPAGFAFPGLAGAAGEERVGEKKTKTVKKTKISFFPFAMLFPALQPAAFNFLLYLVVLMPSLASPHRRHWGGTRIALLPWILGKSRTVRPCEPLLEGTAGLYPRLCLAPGCSGGKTHCPPPAAPG